MIRPMYRMLHYRSVSSSGTADGVMHSLVWSWVVLDYGTWHLQSVCHHKSHADYIKIYPMHRHVSVVPRPMIYQDDDE